MSLETFWFAVIAVLWTGYLFLEGFDFGVGVLAMVLGRSGPQRTATLETIGPVWDGNEVWLIVAIGATFAAFGDWYAALLSGLYLPVVLVLLALIGRGVALEYRNTLRHPRWNRLWDRLILLGSVVPPLGVGYLLLTNVAGLPLDRLGQRVGGLGTTLGWLPALGAVAVLGFSLAHGAVFLCLKTSDGLADAAHRLAVRLVPLALLPMVALVLVLQLRSGTLLTAIAAAVVVIAGLAASLLLHRRAAPRRGRPGWAFGMLALLILGFAVVLFGSMFPVVLPSTLDSANDLTVSSASNSHYALVVVTWVAGFGMPAVIAYQGWTYWVFRKRISTDMIPPQPVAEAQPARTAG